MGMFDSFIDEAGHEWQTKAFERNLDVWMIGDAVPGDGAESYQVEVVGGGREDFRDSLATVRGGILASVDDERDPSLPLLAYYGGRVIEARTS